MFHAVVLHIVVDQGEPSRHSFDMVILALPYLSSQVDSMLALASPNTHEVRKQARMCQQGWTSPPADF